MFKWPFGAPVEVHRGSRDGFIRAPVLLWVSHLDPKSMYKNSPQPLNVARKAIVLRTFVVQVWWLAVKDRSVFCLYF